MGFNQLPEGYDAEKHGPQERQTEFASPEAKLAFDAKNLVEIARKQFERTGVQIEPITLAHREDDNIEALRIAIAEEQGATVEHKPAPELSPEQLWLGQLQARFDSLPQLHEGVQWIDVENSLKADHESMVKLQNLDSKGHYMNVFGEENGEFIFASAWNDYKQVSADHRNIVFDKQAQDNLARQFPDEICNGNATDIAEALGVDLADPKVHEQLRKAIQVNGWAWLKTDEDIRKVGVAFDGYRDRVFGTDPYSHVDDGSFRAALKVKKVA